MVHRCLWNKHSVCSCTLLAVEKWMVSRMEKPRPEHGVSLLQPGKYLGPRMHCQVYIDQRCEICPVCQSCCLDLLPKKALESRVQVSKLQYHREINWPGGTLMSQQHSSRGFVCLIMPQVGSPGTHSSHSKVSKQSLIKFPQSVLMWKRLGVWWFTVEDIANHWVWWHSMTQGYSIFLSGAKSA